MFGSARKGDGSRAPGGRILDRPFRDKWREGPHRGSTGGSFRPSDRALTAEELMDEEDHRVTASTVRAAANAAGHVVALGRSVARSLAGTAAFVPGTGSSWAGDITRAVSSGAWASWASLGGHSATSASSSAGLGQSSSLASSFATAGRTSSSNSAVRFLAEDKGDTRIASRGLHSAYGAADEEEDEAQAMPGALQRIDYGEMGSATAGGGGGGLNQNQKQTAGRLMLTSGEDARKRARGGGAPLERVAFVDPLAPPSAHAMSLAAVPDPMSLPLRRWVVSAPHPARAGGYQIPTHQHQQQGRVAGASRWDEPVVTAKLSDRFVSHGVGGPGGVSINPSPAAQPAAVQHRVGADPASVAASRAPHPMAFPNQHQPVSQEQATARRGIVPAPTNQHHHQHQSHGTLAVRPGRFIEHWSPPDLLKKRMGSGK